VNTDSTLSVHDEGYSRNASCALNLISTFLLKVKSHAFSVRVTLQGIKSRSNAHPHYSHANTKIDELENFNKNNKIA